MIFHKNFGYLWQKVCWLLQFITDIVEFNMVDFLYKKTSQTYNALLSL